MATAFDLWWSGLGTKGKRRFYKNLKGVIDCLLDESYRFAHLPLEFTLPDERTVSAEVTPSYERSESSVTYTFKAPQGILEEKIKLQEDDEGLHILLEPGESRSIAKPFSISVPYTQAEITLPPKQGLDYGAAVVDYKGNLLRITVPFRGPDRESPGQAP